LLSLDRLLPVVENKMSLFGSMVKTRF
jgi:hypothetical protein